MLRCPAHRWTILFRHAGRLSACHLFEQTLRCLLDLGIPVQFIQGNGEIAYVASAPEPHRPQLRCGLLLLDEFLGAQPPVREGSRECHRLQRPASHNLPLYLGTSDSARISARMHPSRHRWRFHRLYVAGIKRHCSAIPNESPSYSLIMRAAGRAYGGSTVWERPSRLAR